MKPNAPSDTVTEVFLSPRVIDRAAFDEYSAGLRELIAGARAESRRLSESAAEAAGAREALRSAAGHTTDQARRGVELARALGARVSGVESTLERAEALSSRLESVVSRAEEVMTRLEARSDSIAALAERFDPERLSAQIARAEAEADRLARLAEQAVASTDRLQRSLDGAIDFTDRLIEQHGTLHQDAERAVGAAGEAARVRDDVRRDLQSIARHMSEVARGANGGSAARY